MDLTPESLREVRFTERFRGYDAGEVDAFVAETADALEELVAEASAPMETLATERARSAIELVRAEALAAVTELQERRAELADRFETLEADLRRWRGGLTDVLGMLDGMIGDAAEAVRVGRCETVGSPEGAAGSPPEGPGADDEFLARLNRAVGTEPDH